MPNNVPPSVDLEEPVIRRAEGGAAGYEHYAAVREGHRNAAEEAWFSAIPNIDARRAFQAGFDAGYNTRDDAARAALQGGDAASEAVEWLRNNYQDHPNIASLCDAMRVALLGNLSKSDLTAMPGHIDERVPVSAAETQEKNPGLVNLGLGGKEHNPQATTTASPHDGSPAEAGNGTATELLAAMQELLACKDIKDRLDAERNDPVTHERANLAADYECRNPWAWKAARNAFAKATAPNAHGGRNGE